MFNRSYAATILLMLVTQFASAQTIVDFDDLLGNLQHGPSEFYYDGHGQDATEGTWSTEGVTFNTGFFGPGWSYSNINDPTTPGYANQFAAITGTDFSGNGNKNYVTGNYSDFAAATTGAVPVINLPANHVPKSVHVTNTTYAFQSMFSGDSFAKKFGGDTGTDPDYFMATFTGFDEVNGAGTVTGSVPFYLADFRSDDPLDDYIVDTWEMVDLTALGEAKSIRLSFETTDIGPNGPNTPKYIAIDSLAIDTISMPEPSAFTLLGFASAAATMMRRRRRVSRWSQ